MIRNPPENADHHQSHFLRGPWLTPPKMYQKSFIILKVILEGFELRQTDSLYLKLLHSLCSDFATRVSHSSLSYAAQHRSASSWADQVGSHLPTDSCKFPTEEITGAHNFNFVSKFPHVGHFQPQISYFWKKWIFRRAKFRGDCTVSRRHWQRRFLNDQEIYTNYEFSKLLPISSRKTTVKRPVVVIVVVYFV